MMELTKERLTQIVRAIDSEAYDEAEIMSWFSSGDIMEMSRQLLTSMEQEPVAWVTMQKEFCDDERTAITNRVDADRYSRSCYDLTPLYAAPQLPQPAVVDEIDALRRDANRYRFLRDKDAFGDEDQHGLASWDDLAELDVNEFDAAVDARMIDSDVPMYATQQAHGVADVEVYAELYRLRAEIKGPDGFETWKDAAIAERKSRIELGRLVSGCVGDIDYLGAMAAFHSDEWHKMGPITGYMHGWNACRAAMLQGAEPVTTAYTLRDGYCIMPMKLTAENGAKGALSGEFSETKFINCPECFGDDECETCDGSGRIEISVPVSWITIKEIWAKGVEHFAAAPQQEVTTDNTTQQKMKLPRCSKHPETELQDHPFEMLLSYPPKPAMYCPLCRPSVAKWVEFDNQLRQWKEVK